MLRTPLPPGTAWANAPAVVDGTVYTTFREWPGLLALDPEDGTERWRAVGPVGSSPVVREGGRCYVGTRDGRIVAVDPGVEVAWSYDLFGEAIELTLRAPTLVAGTAAGEVRALDDADGPGGELWRRKVGGKVVALVQDDGGDVRVSAFGGKLRRLADGAHAGSDRWANRDGGTAQGGIAVAGGLVSGGTSPA